MFSQRVARLELKFARVVPDPQYDRGSEPQPLDPTLEAGEPLLAPVEETQIELWLDRAFRKNDVGPQKVSCIIVHDLEGAFRLGPFEGEAELVKAVIRQVELAEEPF